jgi:catalase
MLMWLMSDRALPKSYRTMEGFGVHTYRFVNAEGKGTFVKFHWKPKLGTHSLVWDETQKIAGADPDFNRRDLWDAIESGNGPEYDFGVQLIPEEREHDFDFDLLDPTKIVPEETVPVRIVGHMVLNRNPDNFFAETEQVAFCVQNVVPGIDFTNDPLLQARLFSYLDTQLIRLGGPNFVQLPVNRPVAEVHHHQRDGYAQHRIDVSPVSYHKNSIAGGCPHLASFDEGAYRHYTERVEGQKIRTRSESFKDFYSQATLFWNSMSEWEQQHIVEALQFELGKVEREYIRERMLEHLAHVDHDLATQVAEGLGLQAPGERDAEAANHGRSSPALSQADQPRSAQTRKVAVLAADGVDSGPIEQVLEKLRSGGVICEVLAPHGGKLNGGLEVDRPLQTMASVLYDAVLVAGGRESADALRSNGAAVRYVAEAYKHAKPLAAIGEGVELLREAPFDDVKLSDNGLVDESGVVTLANGNGELDEFADAFIQALAAHRHFDRAVAVVPA